MKKSPSGYVHLASDGVYRSFNSSNEVLDYQQLSPAEILKLLNFFEKYMGSENVQKTRERMQGVDGRDVTDLDQLLHPSPELCAPRSKK